MSTLLVHHEHPGSQRVPLSPGEWATVYPNTVQPFRTHPAEMTQLPTDAAGAVLCLGRDIFHLALPDSGATFYDAEVTCLPIQPLRERDRIAYHVDSQVVRLWYVRDAHHIHCFNTAPASMACGHRQSPLQASDESVTWTSGDLLHADCLEHGGRRCARCGMEVPLAVDPWLPDGFVEREELDGEK